MPPGLAQKQKRTMDRMGYWGNRGIAELYSPLPPSPTENYKVPDIESHIPQGPISQALQNLFHSRPMAFKGYNFLQGLGLHRSYADRREFVAWKGRFLSTWAISLPESLTVGHMLGSTPAACTGVGDPMGQKGVIPAQGALGCIARRAQPRPSLSCRESSGLQSQQAHPHVEPSESGGRGLRHQLPLPADPVSTKGCGPHPVLQLLPVQTF